ncbi:MAG: hypothetical protein EOP84_23600 [Verrucomicrobiaceae bacterium]|nr:MAG: hypothetical protein EOP84_23600 [Verrucomicrobiaceae bacterium]
MSQQIEDLIQKAHEAFVWLLENGFKVRPCGGVFEWESRVSSFDGSRTRTHIRIVGCAELVQIAKTNGWQAPNP